MKASDEPVVVQQSFPMKRERVWEAITELDQMKQWFFAEIPAFDPRSGFETAFDLQVEEKTYRHLWRIVEAEAPFRIVYDWRYEGCPGRGVVSWELQTNDDGGTLLTLTNEIVEDFPVEDPNFRRESCEGGWQYFVQQQLVSFLSETT